ncbi:hypothetical protein R69658_06857 [Paraburkholderia aspalathi]|uniref:Ribbon-helix-helix protein CopG domain-containing protein n=1 Tax=Paraburkholderia aspalathi TaxID=1324617 RepID=A0ABM8SZN1_9BURK|nr:hypothetical protein [Paraburkholderia aspalathi]MBK3823204.1 hypothetical protein [Paraburkholderia aspalathi]MBK3835035.1 hypothetical protein [Paraburkholderia aspalathi]MBK3864793.1 hypothetical protein [Paraburkholderia aspalathi]CAE6844034.1 hypothetical protein R69658_06857 [Paraburkholderia aspalathi]
MNETAKLGKAISVRLPQKDQEEYTELIERAGLTVSESVRSLVQQVLASCRALDLSSMEVRCEFHWRTPDPDHQFPEHVGDLRVTVSPPAGLAEADLARLVFVIPEFFTDQGEPFRIDSFHFHRVSTPRIEISSTRIRRNVLSFRVIEGVWRAGIFDYGTATDRAAMEERIRQDVSTHIARSIACFLLGQLPETRLLTQDEVAGANKRLFPPTRTDAES